MWKELIVVAVTVFGMTATQASPVFSTPVPTVLTEFRLDLTGIDKSVGGLTNIEYSSMGNPRAWDKKIQVQVNPYIGSWVYGAVQIATKQWIVDVEGNGFSFSDITLWGVASRNYDIVWSEIGLGIIWEDDPNKILFEERFSAYWEITPDPVRVSNVPEPSSLALLSLGLMGVGSIARKKKKIGLS